MKGKVNKKNIFDFQTKNQALYDFLTSIKTAQKLEKSADFNGF